MTTQTVTLQSAAGRWVLAAAVLGSGVAMLDGTVVNVALRAIGLDLGADLQALQWVTNGYLLSLSALILLGGALGDRFGRRRVFVIGVAWFAVGSLLCAISVEPWQLIAARILQGIGGALLTPGSLAMIQGSFVPGDRAKAIGAWSGLGGVAGAVGPFVGGALVDWVSWRWVFLINLPLAAVTIWIAVRHAPESHGGMRTGRFDVPGAALATVGLAGVTIALIEATSWSTGPLLAAWLVGGAALVAFVVVERRRAHPMMPVGLFGSRQFSAANAMTLVTYAALGVMTFFLVLQLQIALGWSALEAGIASLPITVIMLALAAKGGELGQRIGPRLPMTLGPLLCAGGTALLAPVGAGSNYWSGVLPGLVLFGFGLVLLVAPLTATVLAAAPDDHAGIASGINNAVARAGALLAVAALPAIVGLSGDDYTDPARFSGGYTAAMWICVGLLVAGGLVSGALIRNPPRITAPSPTDDTGRQPISGR